MIGWCKIQYSQNGNNFFFHDPIIHSFWNLVNLGRLFSQNGNWKFYTLHSLSMLLKNQPFIFIVHRIFHYHFNYTVFFELVVSLWWISFYVRLDFYVFLPFSSKWLDFCTNFFLAVYYPLENCFGISSSSLTITTYIRYISLWVVMVHELRLIVFHHYTLVFHNYFSGINLHKLSLYWWAIWLANFDSFCMGMKWKYIYIYISVWRARIFQNESLKIIFPYFFLCLYKAMW